MKILRNFLMLLLFIGCAQKKSNKQVIADIKFEYQGCFGGGSSTILITQSDEKFDLLFQPEGGIIQYTKITEKEIFKVERFVTDLKTKRAINWVGSTTDYRYKIKFKDISFEKPTTDTGYIELYKLHRMLLNKS
jgi:hypothetical protein